MRSLLFVPGDSEKKLGKGTGTGADVLLIDLEDSVALSNKETARHCAAGFITTTRTEETRPLLYVRINALDTGLTDDDLDVVMAAHPDGIMLPKSQSGADVTHLDAKITVREAQYGIGDGKTRIIVIATETAASMFTMGTYAGCSQRLSGLTWGAEDLSADLGAETNRGEDGNHLDPYRLARSVSLCGAVAAGTVPIDTVYPNFRDLDGLRTEAEMAVRDGFTAKMAIHPAQVPVINDVFTPDDASIARAKKIIDVFATAENAGVVGLDGEMLDRPHLIRAEKILERARLAGNF